MHRILTFRAAKAPAANHGTAGLQMSLPAGIKEQPRLNGHLPCQFVPINISYFFPVSNILEGKAFVKNLLRLFSS